VVLSLIIITILSLNIFSATANSSNNKTTYASNSNNSKRYEAPSLGISAINLTPEIAKTVGLKQARGVLVTSVVQKGPAEMAGVHGSNNSGHLPNQNSTASEGDVILTIDNITIRNTGDVLVYLLKEKKV